MHRKDCDQIVPRRLDLSPFTSVVLSFAVFDPKTFQIGLADPQDKQHYEDFMTMPDPKDHPTHRSIAIGG
jgi:hypothetical protein